MVTGQEAGTSSPRRVIAASAVGSSHKASQRPNQDAFGWAPRDGDGRRLVLCVSDGHGSRACFRSDIGALLAVAAGCDVGEAFLATLDSTGLQADDVERLARAELPARIVSSWTDRVAADRKARPFQAEELEQAGANSERDAPDPLLPYGATLMMAIVLEDMLVLLQLGDGDIITASPTGRVACPFPGDDRMVAGETVSLCLPDAVELMRVVGIDLTRSPLAILILATDGYGNSFADADWRESVTQDLLSHLYEHGVNWIEDRLQGWLAESADVAGDDVTIGIVAATTLPPRPPTLRRASVMGAGTKLYSAPGIKSDGHPPGPGPEEARPVSNAVRVASVAGQFAFDSGRTVSFGRDASCDVTSINKVVSRRHAELRWQGEEWILVDLRSSRGTFCDDGRQVSQMPVTGSITVWLGPVGTGERLVVETSVPAAARRGVGELDPPATGWERPAAPPEHPIARSMPWPLPSSPPIETRSPTATSGPSWVPVGVGLGLMAFGVLLLLLFLSRGGGGPAPPLSVEFGTAPNCEGEPVERYAGEVDAIYPRARYSDLQPGQQVVFTLDPPSGRTTTVSVGEGGKGCVATGFRVTEARSYGVVVQAAGQSIAGNVSVDAVVRNDAQAEPQPDQPPGQPQPGSPRVPS